jgi:CRP-like cAMP-binding protein
VSLVWWALLLAACLAMLAKRLWENRSVRFSAEEQAMLDRLFTELPRSRARHLIDQGLWLSGKAGDVLTREGEPVDHLYYLAEGEARVISMGSQVGLCRPGDLIGELTVLSGETASATVILNTPARFWCAPADDLRPYVEAHDDIRRAIEHGFATVLKAKLRASNRTIAEAAAHPPG